MDRDLEDHRLTGQSAVDLGRWPTDDDGGLTRAAAEAAMPGLLERMLDLQERLYAGRTRSLLIVLQGRDASGKDGTIKRVMGGFNPLGTRVVAFKAPHELERAHDFLWRVHANVPPAGHVTIFNRSHYEDVLVPGVRGDLGKSALARRHEHIRNFEALLVDAGTMVLKFFLHIGRDEQRERLQERLDDPDKRWKFDPADLQAREQWDRYTKIYRGIFEATATPDAPWFVIPADRKWYRNYLVARVVVQSLESMDLQYPPTPPGFEHLRIP
jgi:PPK2 family polyphosphate:nucleotide phosphotransferase